MYDKVLIRPVQHGLSLATTPLHAPQGYGQWGSQNFKISQSSIAKRSGYVLDRTLPSEEIHAIIYGIVASTAVTVVLTDSYAIKREDSPLTWQYINEEHTGGTAAVNADPSVQIDGTGSDWVDATDDTAPAVGDLFILDADFTEDEEPNGDWREILTIDDDTTIQLTDTYGQDLVATADYTILKKYSVPTNERWSWCWYKEKLYFTNGDVNVQVWDNASRATTLDSTYATKARYCIPYADRLILADLFVSGTRQMYTIMWSVNGDPSDWTDTGSGSADLVDTHDYITGLGVVGASLIVYKQDSLIIGTRSRVAEAPILFTKQNRGIGTPAPYSIVQAHGTNFFIGRSDFFVINGDSPVPIGREVRSRFFDMVNPTELKRSFGYHNELENEVRWFATDDEGERWCFIYDYQHDEWAVNRYSDLMSCGGKGAN